MKIETPSRKDGDLALDAQTHTDDQPYEEALHRVRIAYMEMVMTAEASRGWNPTLGTYIEAYAAAREVLDRALYREAYAAGRRARE
jgi:hypothetical protein